MAQLVQRAPLKAGELPSSSELVGGVASTLVVRGTGLGAADKVALIKGDACPSVGFVPPTVQTFGAAAGASDAVASFVVNLPSELAPHTLTDNDPSSKVSDVSASPACRAPPGSTYAICDGETVDWSVCYSHGGVGSS